MSTLNWAFHSATAINLPWSSELRWLERFRWGAAELWYDKVHAELNAGATCSHLSRQLNDAGVRPAGLCPAIVHTAGEGADAAQERAEFERRLDVAAGLAAGSLTTVVVGKVGPDLDEEYRRVAEKLYAVSILAAARNVRLNVEFLGSWPIVGTLRSCIELLNTVNHPAAGLLFDLCNYYASASHLEELTLLPAGKLFLVHVDDAPRKPMEALRYDDRVFPGEGMIDVPGLLQAIRRTAHYEGYFSLEIFDKAIWMLSPEEAFARAAQSVQHVEQRMREAARGTESQPAVPRPRPPE